MSLVFIVVWLGLTSWCYWISGRSGFSHYSSTVLNPLNVVTLIVALLGIDWAIFVFDRSFHGMFEQVFFLEYWSVVAIGGYVALMAAFLLGGIHAGATLRSPITLPAGSDPNARRKGLRQARIAKWLFLVTLIAASPFVYKLLNSFPAMVAGSITRQVLFREMPIVGLSATAVLITFVFYSASLSVIRWVDIAFLSMVITILGLAGSRGSVVLALLSYGFVAHRAGFRIGKAMLFPAAACLIAVLSIWRFFTREVIDYGSLQDWVGSVGDLVTVLFRTSEIGMAETFSAAVLVQDRLIVAPGTSELGALVYYLPREFFEWKPAGASASFTQFVSPYRWDLTKSELVVTGFANLYLEYGVLLSPVLAMVGGYAWSRFVIRNIATDSVVSRALLVYLIWWMFIFLRGDIFNIGSTLVPVLLCGLFVSLGSRLSVTRARAPIHSE